MSYRKYHLTREAWISGVVPEHAGKVQGEGSEAVGYFWEKDGKFYGAFFGGKRAKPDQYYRYRTDESRAEAWDRYEEDERNAKAEKAERRAKANGFEHTLEAGDILYSTWGYDQTNVDFYQVTRVVGKKTVEIRSIAQTTLSSSQGADYVAPLKDRFLKDSKTETKRVREGNYVTLTSYSSARPYDHREGGVYQTALGWGH